MPAEGQSPVYDLGECEVDLARRELRVGGTLVPVGGRAFEIIAALVNSGGDVVSKDALMERVWPGAIVEDNTLQAHISAVRRALGTQRNMLKTEAGRGYRLLGSWTVRSGGAPAVPAATPDERPRQEPAWTLPTPPSHSNVPVAASGLIGRETAVRQLIDLLSMYRAVTLTGPGGIGKTALALEVARCLLPGFPAGAWLVELAALSDPALVSSTAAGVLGLRLGSDVISAEAVAAGIGDKAILLVLDNCEHMVEEAATLAETLLRLCPRTTILATSREVLRIDGEYVYRVAPLEVPPLDQEEPGAVLGHSAVALFIDRTRALDGDFSPDPEIVPAIAAICRQLDGIPLAIEFAAARAATLGTQEVAARLSDRFALLTGGRRTALPRHQTLRAAFDWSYDLLPEAERRLLRRAAVFAGGFTLEAVAAVTADADEALSSVADGISNLVSKSLVTFNDTAPVGRWRLLETIRAYAAAKLAASEEGDDVARRHAEYFHTLVAPTATNPVLRLSIEDVTRYGREIDNVRAALDWSFSATGDAATGVALTAAFAPIWLHLSLAVECRERIERALSRLAPGADLPALLERRLHMALAVALILTMGPAARAKAAMARARTIAESSEDLDGQLRMLWVLWSVQFTAGECRAAHATAERFSDVARRTGDEAAVLVAVRLTGNTLQYAGRPRDARPLVERVRDRYVAPESQRHTILFQYDQHALARAMLARVLWLQGFVDRATAEARASFEEAQAVDPGFSLCWVLRYAVFPLAVMTGDIAGADRAVATLTHIGARLNAAAWKAVARCWQGKVLIERGEFAQGVALLRDGVKAFEETGWLLSYPEFSGMLAEGLAGLGEVAEALAAADRGLAIAEQGGERWFVAELLRIKGEILAQQENQRPGAAEDSFRAALQVARDQGALFWELRAALSLARLRVSEGRPEEAGRDLAPVYRQFTEGFGTPDLRAAKKLLDALPPGASHRGG